MRSSSPSSAWNLVLALHIYTCTLVTKVGTRRICAATLLAEDFPKLLNQFTENTWKSSMAMAWYLFEISIRNFSRFQTIYRGMELLVRLIVLHTAFVQLQCRGAACVWKWASGSRMQCYIVSLKILYASLVGLVKVCLVLRCSESSKCNTKATSLASFYALFMVLIGAESGIKIARRHLIPGTWLNVPYCY